MNQFHVPTLSPVNKILIGICVLGFILVGLPFSPLAGMLSGLFILSPSAVFKGQIWQLVTYVFVSPRLMDVLFNGLLIWFIGSDLEQMWGRKFYLQFLFTSVIASGILYCLMSLGFGSLPPLMGMTGFSYALLIAYAILFSERTLTFMLIFPMKAKYFCWLLIGVELFMGLSTPMGPQAWGHLGAMLVAFIFMLYKSRASLSAPGQAQIEKLSKNWKKRKFKVIQGGEGANEDDPKYWQ